MRVTAVCAALIAAFAVALVVGKASAGDGGDSSADVQVVTSSDDSMKAPKLGGTGSIPELQQPPAPSTSSTTSTSSGTTSSTPATSTPSVQSTGGGGSGGGGGGGATPPPAPSG